MSLLPYVFDHHVPRFPGRLLDQDFGMALTPDDRLTAVSPVISRDYYRPWRQLAARDIGSNIKCDKDKFQVHLDVKHFAPEEMSVKTANGYVIVEGKHEEKKDEHGYISRQFMRKYALPEGCQDDNVESRLSSDGVLIITAPRHKPAVKGEKTVPIQQIGPVGKKITDNAVEEKPEQKKESHVRDTKKNIK